MPAIQRAQHSELRALASRDAAKLAEARTRFPGLATDEGYAALLARDDVDAVYIPLPNAQHYEWALAAMRAGKHVLCEKPLTLTAAETRTLIAASERAGVRLMEAFMYRYTARTRAVVDVLRSGVLGEIRQVEASFRFPLTNPASIKLQPALGGGSLYDVGCYPVNLVGLIVDTLAGGAPGAGGQPESIVAESTWSGGVDVNFGAVLRYRSGLLATIGCGFNAQKRVLAAIVGTQGVLEVPDTYFDPAGALTLTLGEERREIPVPASDRYRAEVEDFAGAILEQRAPQFSLVESLRSAEVIDRLLAATRREG
jgi:predicted dehydrogenase